MDGQQLHSFSFAAFGILGAFWGFNESKAFTNAAVVSGSPINNLSKLFTFNPIFATLSLALNSEYLIGAVLTLKMANSLLNLTRLRRSR